MNTSSMTDKKREIKKFVRLFIDTQTPLGIHNELLGIHVESNDPFQLLLESTFSLHDISNGSSEEESQFSMVIPTEDGFIATKIFPENIHDLRGETGLPLSNVEGYQLVRDVGYSIPEWGVLLPDKDIQSFLNGFFRISSSNQHRFIVSVQKWNALSLHQKFQLFLTCNSNFAFAKEKKLWTHDFMMSLTDEELILEILTKKEDWIFLITRLNAAGPTESFEFVL